MGHALACTHKITRCPAQNVSFRCLLQVLRWQLEVQSQQTPLKLPIAAYIIVYNSDSEDLS